MSAAHWAQWFRRSMGRGLPERLQPVFRAALQLSNARCVPRVGASRSIKIFSRSACMWRYATRHVCPRSATMKSASASRTLLRPGKHDRGPVG